MTAPKIGVFDSGVGGLSILQAVRERLPGAQYAYCSDDANFPYGTKPEEQVVACTHEVADRFIVKESLDLLVIACNTASTVALPKLRASFQVPVVGVVPAIKPAAQMSRSHTIGLLATPATVVRPYTDELIKQFASACRVVRQGSTRLVTLAEQKLRGEPVDLAEVRAELAPLFAQSPHGETDEWKRLDTVVLGCTHFPLLVDELTKAAPWPVQWVDSGQAIAARTAFLLMEKGADAALQPRTALPPPRAYVTKGGPSADALRPALERLGFAELAVL